CPRRRSYFTGPWPWLTGRPARRVPTESRASSCTPTTTFGRTEHGARSSRNRHESKAIEKRYPRSEHATPHNLKNSGWVAPISHEAAYGFLMWSSPRETFPAPAPCVAEPMLVGFSAPNEKSLSSMVGLPPFAAFACRVVTLLSRRSLTFLLR